EYLHSHNYQHCLKILDQDWKSYFKAIKDYKNNPSKYLGKPKPPKFKNLDKKKNQVIFTKLAIRTTNNIIKLSLSKKVKSMFNVESLNFELTKQVQKQIDIDNIQQIRIAWDNALKRWYLVIIYKVDKEEMPKGYNNIM